MGFSFLGGESDLGGTHHQKNHSAKTAFKNTPGCPLKNKK
jgi:hypothetical protein